MIIDDYGAIPACKQAVDEFRGESGIREPRVWIDWTGVFWRVERGRLNAALAQAPDDLPLRHQRMR